LLYYFVNKYNIKNPRYKKRNVGPKLSESAIPFIKQCIENKETFVEISKKLKIHIRSLYKFIKKHNIKYQTHNRRNGGPKISESDILFIEQCIENKETLVEISKKLNVSWSSLHRFVRKHNIKYQKYNRRNGGSKISEPDIPYIEQSIKNEETLIEIGSKIFESE
jgi:IS30 family transposase